MKIFKRDDACGVYSTAGMFARLVAKTGHQIDSELNPQPKSRTDSLSLFSPGTDMHVAMHQI